MAMVSSERPYERGTRVVDAGMPHRTGLVMGYARSILGGAWYMMVRWDGEPMSLYVWPRWVRAVA